MSEGYDAPAVRFYPEDGRVFVFDGEPGPRNSTALTWVGVSAISAFARNPTLFSDEELVELGPVVSMVRADRLREFVAVLEQSDCRYGAHRLAELLDELEGGG